MTPFDVLAGRELPGHRAVRRVAGGRAALHPLPGHCAAGAPAAAAVLLRVRRALHRRRGEALQPGAAQVRRPPPWLFYREVLMRYSKTLSFLQTAARPKVFVFVGDYFPGRKNQRLAL